MFSAMAAILRSVFFSFKMETQLSKLKTALRRNPTTYPKGQLLREAAFG
jgi:hypothetical protein